MQQLTDRQRQDAEAFSGDLATRRPQAFVVQIKRGDQVSKTFDAMGTSKVSVQKQHEGLCADGEQCVVLTPEQAQERHREVIRKVMAARAHEQGAIDRHHTEERMALLDTSPRFK